MVYRKTVLLRDGRTCILRNAEVEDAPRSLELNKRTRTQSDFLLSYPDEQTRTVDEVANILKAQKESPDEIELVAEIDGVFAGLAGVHHIGTREKIRHRATFGVSVDKSEWGRGVGRALTEACVECAKAAGYVQLELSVVADNRRAISLYKSVGFTEFGRNPKGFRSRLTGWQEIVDMRLELVPDDDAERREKGE